MKIGVRLSRHSREKLSVMGANECSRLALFSIERSGRTFVNPFRRHWQVRSGFIKVFLMSLASYVFFSQCQVMCCKSRPVTLVHRMDRTEVEETGYSYTDRPQICESRQRERWFPNKRSLMYRGEPNALSWWRSRWHNHDKRRIHHSFR